MAKKSISAAEIMSGNALGSVMPLVDISGGVMIFGDGSLSVGFSCRANVTSQQPTAQREAVYSAMLSALRMLPETANGQVYWAQQARPADFTRVFDPGPDAVGLVKEAIEDRSAIMRRGLEEGRMRTTTVDIYINVPPEASEDDIDSRVSALERSIIDNAPSKGVGVFDTLDRKILRPIEGLINKWLNPMSGAVVLAYEEYAATRKKVLYAADSLRLNLMQAGLQPTPLGPDEIMRRYYRKNNPSKFENGGEPRKYAPESKIPVAEHFLSSPVEWDPTGRSVPKGMIYVDGYYHAILTMKNPPEQMSFPHLEGPSLFGGLTRMESIVNFHSISVIDRIKADQDEIKAIENNNKDDTAAVKLEQLRQEIRELGSGEEKLWNAQHIFVVRERSIEAVQKAANELITLGQKAEQVELTDEVHAVFQYWMASQPGWARDRDFHRHNIYNTRQLVAMLPIFGGYTIREDQKIGALLETSDGSVFSSYLFDNQVFASPSLLIVGRSRSGKSVVANTFFTQHMRHKPRMIIVDMGNSYKRLCHALDGSYIEYNIKSADCRINPFDLFAGRVADAEEIQSVILQLETMLYDPKTDGNVVALSRDQRNTLEEAINTLIRKSNGQTFFLSNLRDTLQAFNTATANDLVTRLQPFCEGGTFENLFDGPTNVPQNKRVIVYELQRVKDNTPALLPIVFQIILQNVVALASKYPNEKKILGMDETHILLEHEHLRKFVEVAFRTFGKLGVGVVGISQGIGDWIVKDNPMAILGNVSGIIACAQKPESVRQMSEIYKFSANTTEMLTQLRVIPGVLSECMVINDASEGLLTEVCANRLPDIEYAMYTTHADDTSLMNRWMLKNEGMTFVDAVRKFAKVYPRGVFAAGGPRPEDKP